MLYAIVAVLALILDQAVKYWTTVNIIVDTGEAKLIPGFIHLANVHNTGAAFSFLEGARWFFVILCILFCLLVIYVLVKNIITNRLARWMAVLVMAGAIGNCIDRIVCGFVVDMFEFDFLLFGKQFPVFNVADIYITLGAIIFCICILTEKPKAAQNNVPYSKGRADEEKKPSRPLLSRRQKTPIPDFPKHEKAPQQPGINPEDPFAEWEKRGDAASAAHLDTQDKNYSQDAVEFVNILSESPQPAAPASQTTPVRPAPKEPAAPVRPAAPAPAPAPKPAAAPSPSAEAPKAESDSFNLDDILAEFRDL